MGQVKTVLKVIEGKPYRVKQVRADDGSLVWIETGINPDDIFLPKRRSEWPFSEAVVDQILNRIAEGESLTQICRDPGMPSYNIICQWRKENPHVTELLKMAYEDQNAEFENKMYAALSLFRPGNFRVIQQQIEKLKRMISRNGVKEPENNKDGIYIINTGVRRRTLIPL